MRFPMFFIQFLGFLLAYFTYVVEEQYSEGDLGEV